MSRQTKHWFSRLIHRLCSRCDLLLENLALRQQIEMLKAQDWKSKSAASRKLIKPKK
jgi:hypothetical protein